MEVSRKGGREGGDGSKMNQANWRIFLFALVSFSFPASFICPHLLLPLPTGGGPDSVVKYRQEQHNDDPLSRLYFVDP